MRHFISSVKTKSLASRAKVLLLLINLIVLMGCAIIPSHLHNETNANIAAKAQTEMAEYAKNAPNMYSAMLSNIEKFKVEEEYLLTELATNFNTALITKLPTMTWEQINDRIKKCNESIAEFEKQIVEEANKGRANDAKLKDADNVVKDAQKAVQEAKENLTAWNAYVALIQQGFGNISTDFSKLSRDNGVDALVQAANNIGQKKITFIDADGKEVKKTVKEILKDRLPSEKDWRKFKMLPDAPGITLLIMNMGLELAQIEQKRIESQLSRFNARAVLYEDSYISMKLAEQLSEEIQCRMDKLNEVGQLGNQVYGDIFGQRLSARRAGNDITYMNAIASDLVMLRKEALVESIIARNEALFKVTIARLDHADSINESIAGDAAWQAVIKSGIDGLAAYHQSGFTKEDAANIIRIAQTIALAFIAVGTN